MDARWASTRKPSSGVVTLLGATGAQATQRRTPRTASSPDPVPPITVLEALLAGGADPSASGALVAAIRSAPEAHARRLIAAGADPNAESHGTRPLHAAFQRGLDDLAAVLVRAGADPVAADAAGTTLEAVYGPDGGDVRPIAVRWTGDGPLVLDLGLVLGHASFAGLPHALRLASWVQAGLAGLHGGARVSGEPIAVDGAPIGPTRRRVRWTLEGASSAFVRWMLGSLLYAPAGVDRPARVVSLAADGGPPGPSLVSADEVRQVARDPSSTFVAGPTPIPIAVADGPPEVRIVPVGSAGEAAGLLEARAQVWMDHVLQWQVGFGSWTPAFAAEVREGAVRLAFVAHGGAKWAPTEPWRLPATRASLEQIVAAIHADVPLVSASIALPPSAA